MQNSAVQKRENTEKMGTKEEWKEKLSSELIQNKNTHTLKSLHALFTIFHNKLSSSSLALESIISRLWLQKLLY